jgi:hypothetical protein
MLTDEQIIALFGQPGDPDNLTVIQVPFPLRIAWDLKHTTQKVQCHKKIANNLLAVFNDLLAHYGLAWLQKLGIDLYGGCYNFRKMRGGNRWSRHSWGIAIDLDPVRNGLRIKKPAAQFSKPEYKPMIDIFYKHGFIGYGPEKDYDWMHFEINKTAF